MSRFSPDLLDRIRDGVALSDIVGRHVTWDRRKTNAARRDYWACCPFHGEKTPSFHVDDRRGFYKCFGCKVSGDVYGFLKNFEGLSFADSVYHLAGLAGITVPDDRVNADPAAAQAAADAAASRWKAERDRRHADRASDEARDRAGKIAAARGIWRSAAAITGTVAETYLRSRHITCDLPPSLRFSGRLRHVPSRQDLPAMVAAMQGGDRRICGVHRTYLKADGSGKADVEPSKMMLGVAQGAAVRFCPPAAHLYVAEGIETALSVISVRPDASVWAALSLDNMEKIALPDEVRHVTLVADNDQKDWRAGRRAVKQAVSAHAVNGRQVSTVWPPRGCDFNDVLARAAR